MVPSWLVLRRLVCALSSATLLAMPAVHAAESRQRVQVNYPEQSGAKAAVKSNKKTAAKSARKSKAAAKALAHKPSRKPGAASHDRLDLAADGRPNIKSASALVVDFKDGQTIFSKNTRIVTPIASITKLMTAMVVLDASLPLEETILIDLADQDFVKHTSSRLAVGTALPRRDMLRLALMSSENRAAASLARAYPGGIETFIPAMNRKAVELGMWDTRFSDSTGLSSENVSTAEDLVKMVKGAFQYPLIREFTTATGYGVETATGRNLQYSNSNGLVKNSTWEIGLSKTGFINEAGRCLVMQAKIASRPVVIVLLDSWGKYTRTADANRIKKWLESHYDRKPRVG